MTGAVTWSVTDMSGYICLLEDIDDKNIVGGKAWNLSRMLRLGLPVPPGFVITNAAFQHFLADNMLHDQIQSIYTGIELSDLQALQNASRIIQAKILSAPIPDAVSAALQEGYRLLGSEDTLIVRSSAVGEASCSSSFAGQLDSFLDITSDAGGGEG